MRERMRSTLRAAVVIVILIAGLLLPAQAKADFPGLKYLAAGFDAVILRPIGLAAVISGSALFLPAALVSAPGGRDAIDEVTERFVTEPVKSTFQRPLGEF